MQDEYIIALAGKANRSMDRIFAHPLLHSTIAPMFYIFAQLRNELREQWNSGPHLRIFHCSNVKYSNALKYCCL